MLWSCDSALLCCDDPNKVLLLGVLTTEGAYVTVVWLTGAKADGSNMIWFAGKDSALMISHFNLILLESGLGIIMNLVDVCDDYVQCPHQTSLVCTYIWFFGLNIW